MCGLVTIVSKQQNGIFHSDMKVFTELLFADQLRGGDGTGIIYNNKKEIRTLKAAVGSSDFVMHPQYDKACAAIIKEGNFVVGHNRAATKGKIIQENTHPFKHKHITLVHNGTLSFHKYLADVEVDSHAICISIAEKGMKETLKKVYGAYALIWTDSKQKTLNFIRNSQRPLYVIETPFLFVFVSEKKLAEWILDRNNQHINSIKEVPIHTLFQFEFGKWDKYETQKIEGDNTESFTPYKKQTSIVPYSGSVDDIVESDPKVGDYIRFVPTVVDKDFGIKLLGEFEDKTTGESIEVKWWTKDKETAYKYVNEIVLEGKITHIAYKPSAGLKYYIVDNCTKASIVSAILAKSNNGIPILQEDIDRMEPKCNCCNTAYDKKYIKEHIDQCDFDLRGGKVGYTCPDCTAWVHNNFHNGAI